MIFSQKRIGELLTIVHALLWALFPAITILTLAGITPLFSAALSTLIASVFFAVVITIRRQWHQLWLRSAWKDVFLTALIIGILYYGLFFIGLKYTTAGNASIVALMEVFFTYLIISVLLKHEDLIPLHMFGAVLMFVGAVVILYPKTSHEWHWGDLIIIAATAIAPIGNKYQKSARSKINSELVMFIRSVIAGAFLLFLAVILDPWPTRNTLKSVVWPLLVNGIILMGIEKIVWIEAIHRIPITKAIALSSILPLFALLFAYLLLGEHVASQQIAGMIPMMIGVWLLMR